MAVLAATLAFNPLPTSANLQPLPPTSVPQPPVALQQNPDVCTNSPFGTVLDIANEHEVFIGFEDGAGGATDGRLRYDRLDVAPGANFSRQAEYTAGTGNITTLQATGADLDGDGRSEYLQAYTFADRIPRIRAHGDISFDYSIIANSQAIAVAAGDFDRDELRDDEFLLISSEASLLRVNLLNYDTSGGSTELIGRWQSTDDNLRNASVVQAATGDIDGDGADELLLLLVNEFGATRLLAIKYRPGVQSGSGDNFKVNMLTLATTSFSASNLINLRLAVGNVDDEFKEDIVVGWDFSVPGNPGFGVQGNVEVFGFENNQLSTKNLNWSEGWSDGATNTEFALGLGNLDGQGPNEILLAYNLVGNNNRLIVRSLHLNVEVDPDSAARSYELQPALSWENSANGRDDIENLTMDVGDIDRDTRADVVLAFRDASNALQTIQINQPTEVTPVELRLLRQFVQSDSDRRSPRIVTVTLADADNDSLQARFSPQTLSGRNPSCLAVDPEVTSAVFVPPYWTALQADNPLRTGRIGEIRSGETITETSVINERGEAFSAYVGGGIEFDVFSASARATAAYEYSVSRLAGEASAISEVVQQGDSSGENFVRIEELRHYCYNYQVYENDAPIEDSSLRFCTYQESVQSGPSIDGWDATFGPAQGVAPNNRDAPQWAPITRDWSNLALFRGDFSAQAGSNNADISRRAVDGNTSGVFAEGSVTVTPQQNAPWWQIDLGATRDIANIRVWNRSEGSCDGQPCQSQLNNFYVFISNTPFEEIAGSNNPTTLANAANVRAYFHSGPAGEVTNFLTLRSNPGDTANPLPVRGRYVRVQLSGAGVLSLAEVQIFGPNHVEPYRYPRAIRDQTPDDGRFEAEIYNPLNGQWQWVPVRGNLLWNGAENDVLTNRIVTGGDSGAIDWSLTQEQRQTLTTGSAFSSSTRVGIEFDGSAGYIAQIQAGGSYEQTSGVTNENSRSVTIGEGFEISGLVTGFPGATWPQECEYGLQPYYYETSSESTLGFEHRFIAVDYIVPGSLDRNADLSACMPQSAPPADPVTEVQRSFLPLVLRL